MPHGDSSERDLPAHMHPHMRALYKRARPRTSLIALKMSSAACTSLSSAASRWARPATLLAPLPVRFTPAEVNESIDAVVLLPLLRGAGGS